MTEHASGRVWSGIDVPKTVAGVLAAVSAAVIGSFLGVAGTLIGAAVASLISSVGTEVYHRTLDRGRKKLQGTFLTAPAAVGTPAVAVAEEESPSEQTPKPQIRWRRVALVAGALFVLALGTLTVAEVISGRSIADATRGGSGNGLTLTSIFDDKSGTPAPAETDESPAPARSAEPGGGQTTAPAGDAEPTAPADTTGEATTEPVEPTPTAPAPDAGTGDQNADPKGAGGPGGDTQNLDDGTD